MCGHDPRHLCTQPAPLSLGALFVLGAFEAGELISSRQMSVERAKFTKKNLPFNSQPFDTEDRYTHTADETTAVRMAPKKKPSADGDDNPASKKAKAEGAASESGPVTSGAKAAAAGADYIQRTPTPRKALLDQGGLVLIHWNIAGLNGLLKNEERRARLVELVDKERPDVLALSEHKISSAKLADAQRELLAVLPGFTAHWAVCTAKNGYSGVVALVREGSLTPTSVALDVVCGSLNEGRTISLSFAACHVVMAYVPNSGQKLERLE